MKSYSFDKGSQLLFVKTFELIGIEDICENYERIRKDDTLPENLNVLIDAQGSRFNFKADHLDHVRESLGELLDKCETLKEAILVDQPYETAISTLFSQLFSDRDTYRFAVFSTRKEALLWLNTAG